MRTALVIGTGLVGTSAALALAGRGVQVHLVDRDPSSAHTAAALGAGTDEAPEGTVDLAVVAVPPAHTASVLATAMRDGVARAYLDVASVKGGPRRELESLGVDLTPYIGTHPMAARSARAPSRPPPTSSRAAPGSSHRPGRPTPRSSTSPWNWSRSAAPSRSSWTPTPTTGPSPWSPTPRS